MPIAASRRPLIAEALASALEGLGPSADAPDATPIPLADFVRGAWPVVEPETPYIHNWHIDAICEHLEAVSRGQIRRLLINIPPGHMKSLIVAVFWPAWVWTWRPGWRALFASYAMELALRDSVKCRDVITSDWYQETFCPAWRLEGDQNVKSYFANTRTGYRMALGVLGKVTGFRGDAVVVDDPLNAEDAYSDLAREKANRWWFKSMSTRLNDQRAGARIVIMQRLHTKDLSGEILARGGYEHLCLPSEFEPERAATTSIGWRDPRTEAGELLFPEMSPASVLAEAKRDLGSDGYAGQHQQRPQPLEGGMFKRAWWRYFTVRPTVPQQVIQVWDMAFKDTKGSSYVVCLIMARIGGDVYILDRLREHLDMPATLKAVRMMSEKWPEAALKLVEDKANGPAVIATLRHDIPGLVAISVETSKVARAAAVTPYVEAGNVYLPKDASWVDDYVGELAAFPTGAHDDQVDATSMGLARLMGKPAQRTWPESIAPSGAASAAHQRY